MKWLISFVLCASAASAQVASRPLALNLTAPSTEGSNPLLNGGPLRLSLPRVAMVHPGVAQSQGACAIPLTAAPGDFRTDPQIEKQSGGSAMDPKISVKGMAVCAPR